MPNPGPGSELLEDPGRLEDRDQDCRADDRQDERHHLTAANTELGRQPTDDAANDQPSEGPMCDECATAAGW